jgi:protein-tyrosine phosphatase
MAWPYWIDLPLPGRLATAARPRGDDGLEGEIAGWAADGVDTVVCLLALSEVHELGLQREEELCKSHGLAFVSFPIPDYGLPESRPEVSRLARRLVDGLEQGRSIIIHCRAGIGRSSMIAACTMICAGFDAADALARIEAARGVRVPDTEAQRAWVMAFSGE